MYLQSEWQTIHSKFLHTLHLVPLPPYSTNTTNKPHTPVETSLLTATIFIRDLSFTDSIHLFMPPPPQCRHVSFKYLIVFTNTRQCAPHLCDYFSSHTVFISIFCNSVFAKFYGVYSFIWVCSMKRHYLKSTYLVRFHIL